jgi:hypothetical protein
MKTHGDSGWETFPSYLDLVVPRILSCFKHHDLLATFFLVGQDAAFERNHDLYRSIVRAGHEVGNHSFGHEPWLHLYSPIEIETDLSKAEEEIERATGQKPVGFRGPGYSLSQATLDELARRGYLYDATTFPTFLTPLARLYYFSTADFSPEEKRRRSSLGGKMRDGFRPNGPYCWQVEGRYLFEIPVTTMPFLKLPMHMTFLFGLFQFSPAMAMRYFESGLRLCRLARVQPSIVFHPTDFLGCDDEQELSFIPGMGLPLERKLEFLHRVLERLKSSFSVVTLREHAVSASRQAAIPVLSPSF